MLVVKKDVENKRYTQSIASNSLLCHLPGLEDLSRKTLQGIAYRYAGFIVSLLEKTVVFDVIDIRDSRNWATGYVHIYEFALSEVEKPEESDQPIMCAEVRLQRRGAPALAKFVFAERYPTHPSCYKECNCRSGKASTASKKTLASCRHNELHSVINAVRESMQTTKLQLNQGFWNAVVVDKCIKEVNEKYGSSRDITGRVSLIYHGVFLRNQDPLRSRYAY